MKRWYLFLMKLKRMSSCTMLLFICTLYSLPCLAATFRFTGQVTAVYPEETGFPEEYLSVTVGDDINGRIRYTGSGVVNPFGVWEQSTQYAFLPADSSYAGTMGAVPFAFNDQVVVITVWNNDNLDYLIDCSPLVGDHDGILFGTTGQSLVAPSLTIGNYCLPATIFENETLPGSAINGNFFFQIAPLDLSSVWISGTIDSVTYGSPSQELPGIMLLLGPEDGGCALEQASGSITTVAGTNLLDGEFLIISDGNNSPTVFEFDLNGDGVSAGNVPLTFSAASSADNVRDVIITGINSIGASLQVSAANGGQALVNLLNDTAGASGNQPVIENVADVTFVVTGMSGGCD